MKLEPFKMTLNKKRHTRLPLENLGSGFDTPTRGCTEDLGCQSH
jgi:hypothetical protein